ncbi:adenosine kinase [Lichenihabitans sp. PAMC28606]|uniref:adenosine kinase n=1 Tax=Lichenihabitans sp. PAMC28606 TaxID=2880932 RepID=UPI001D0A4796|nr:adenosine kinase [Lichenihabitans sp. PAMC28606]UDL94440.1 adenosine kinase [Lichenihabitans sp. PAMC28606]
MPNTRFDVLCLGNAIVDIIAPVEDAFLIKQQVAKGAMILIDEPRAEDLYGAMGPATVISGGSAANTAVGLASFGVRAGYVGKVRTDDVGALFTNDLRATGVTFDTAPAQDGPATARSFILVTPDGQRTMNTYLGACQNLTEADIDDAAVQASGIVYLEGYLWDPAAAKTAFLKAAGIAHANGSRVALTLSDSFCVDRYRSEFLDLIRTKVVDIVFANESELHALYQTSDFQAALSALREEDGLLGVITKGAEGSVIVTQDETLAVDAFPIETLVDSTGAGDLFAAGFLAGLAKDKHLRTCARLGALAAAEVIQHIGARPATSLAVLASQNGLTLDR